MHCLLWALFEAKKEVVEGVILKAVITVIEDKLTRIRKKTTSETSIGRFL